MAEVFVNDEPSGAEVFVGRDPERELLQRALEGVQGGCPAVVVVEGVAGVGKTALVRQFLAGQPDLRVLAATGDEGETSLAYGVMDQLWVQAGLTQPPALPRLASGPAAIPEPVAVGAQLVAALGSLQDSGPIVLLLDDAMWADTPSLQALTFALRRLHADRVLALILLRTDTIPVLPEGLRRLLEGERGTHLRLEGLDGPGVRTLAKALGRGELSEWASERLRSHTSGNPLHIRALLEELAPGVLEAGHGALAAPRSLSVVVLARLAACPAAGRTLVIAGSVLGMRFDVGIAARLAGVADPLLALEQTAGLIVLPSPGETTVSFSHPLLHAAIYQDLGPARRAALHAQAAELVGDEASSLRHHIAATAGQDACLSVQVAAFARREAARGAWSTTGSYLLSAARLTPDDDEAERLLLEALEWMVLAGELAGAAAEATRIAAFSDPARRQYGLGFLAFFGGRVDEADALLGAAWESCDHCGDPGLAARIAGRLAYVKLYQARGSDAVEWSRRTLALTSGENPLAFGAHWTLHVGLVISGRSEESLAILEAVPEVAEDPAVGLAVLLGRAPVRLWTDDLAGALADMSRFATRWREVPMPYGLFALGGLSDICYRLGDWDAAVVHGELAASAAGDAGQVWVLPFVHTYAASPLACRGEWAAAQAHVTTALEVARQINDRANIAYACSAAALVASVRGEWAEVVGVVDPLLGFPERDGTDEPGILPWRELYTDALVNLGRLDEAEHALIPFEEIAAERGRRSAMANAARVRGRLEAARSCRDAAEAAFQASLGHAGAVAIPFDRARTELAYGAFLRRVGRRSEAVTHLKASRRSMERLKAQPFLERCDRELAGCGLSPVKRKSGAHRGALTPQELSVASLVTAGLTNRQVASELVVSTKTVEYHLANVYTKLGVSSRTQLAARFAKQ